LFALQAVLAATQTFLGFAKRSEQHVQAADWYAAIRRKIDELLAFRPRIGAIRRRSSMSFAPT
jgi:hypothetical protein